MRTSTRRLVLVLAVGLLAAALVGAASGTPGDRGTDLVVEMVVAPHEAGDRAAPAVTNDSRRWQQTLPDGRRLFLAEIAALVATLAVAGSLRWARRPPITARPHRSRASGALTPSRAPPQVAHTS